MGDIILNVATLVNLVAFAIIYFPPYLYSKER